jgi:hypothetical protein
MGKLQTLVYVALCSLAACQGEQVGRLCDLGAVPQPGEVVVASPALDCVSRECLSVPPPSGVALPAGLPTGANGMCTAECTQDSDCETVPESPCSAGFACEVAVTVGAFCCQKFCVCRDYGPVLVDGSAACDATNSANTCCNLAGRADNAAYPLCQ